MGCGASKGKEESSGSSEGDINFKKTNCEQMDDFFNKCTDTITAITDITGPLGD